jgi:hypothetical protein
MNVYCDMSSCDLVPPELTLDFVQCYYQKRMTTSWVIGFCTMELIHMSYIYIFLLILLDDFQ